MKEINKIIPEAEIKSSTSTQLLINIPNKNTNDFPDLFKLLETNRTTFGIKGMGLSYTTMEDVFLK